MILEDQKCSSCVDYFVESGIDTGLLRSAKGKCRISTVNSKIHRRRQQAVPFCILQLAWERDHQMWVPGLRQWLSNRCFDRIAVETSSKQVGAMRPHGVSLHI
jgi:hypothetical protein